MLRLRDVFNTARWRDQGIVQFNMAAVGVLGVLFVTVLVLTALCIGLPLLFSGSRARPDRRRAPSGLFRRDRFRVHARRDLTGAAAGDLSGPSCLQPLGRALLAAPVERRGQRVHGASARRDCRPRGPRLSGSSSSWSSWWRSAPSHRPPCGSSRRPRQRCGFWCRWRSCSRSGSSWGWPFRSACGGRCGSCRHWRRGCGASTAPPPCARRWPPS